MRRFRLAAIGLLFLLPGRVPGDDQHTHDRNDSSHEHHAHDQGHDHAHKHAEASASHDDPPAGDVAEPAAIETTGVTLRGTWLFPDRASRVPCVILVGGTLSHTRDGALIGHGQPGETRDALRRMAYRLSAAGYASLRWDKRGYGESPSGSAAASNEIEGEDVASAIRLAQQHARVSNVIVAGESAGGYFACLAAENGTRADGYIFQGALASPSEKLFRYNFERLAEWAGRSDENLKWAKKHALFSLATGHHVDELFEAATNSKDMTFTFAYDGTEFTRSLVRIRTEIQKPPAELFRHIQRPSLVLQGAEDMNVPPGDAQIIAEIIRESGVKDVRAEEIPGVDHSFQYVAQTEDARMRDRHAFTSFYYLYSPRVYEAMIAWLNERFPTPAFVREYVAPPRPGIVHWKGIQMIEDITDQARNPGVNTLEGCVGPLLNGDHGQARFFVLPPGLYVDEHPHSTESIIYTVEGNYVLCSSGRRTHMKPGSLFWFQAHAPTGWEVPFDEPAYILIFKAPKSDWSDEKFWEYLGQLAQNCRQQNEAGTPFRFSEIASHHPARKFARKINPDWEAKLPGGRE